MGTKNVRIQSSPPQKIHMQIKDYCEQHIFPLGVLKDATVNTCKSTMQRSRCSSGAVIEPEDELWSLEYKEHQLVLNRSRHQVKTRHQEGNNRNWSTFVCESKDLVCVWSAAVCVSTSHFWPYSSSATLSSCFEAFSTWIPELLYSRQPRCYTELHFTVPLRACLVFKMVRRFPFFPPKPQPFIFLLLPADLFLPSIHPSTVAWPQFFSSTLDVSLTMDLLPLGDTSSCDLLPVAQIFLQ